MKNPIFFILAIAFGFLTSCQNNATEVTEIETSNIIENPTAIVIHGGAGAMDRSKMSDSLATAYKTVLEKAVSKGYEILKNGGEAIDAVTTAIIILEDSPLFNAGKGAVFTHEETHELDASIMLGNNKDAGAVSGVTQIKNPILLAKEVMLNSPHVMLSGNGAERFAVEQGFELVDPSYFYTENRKKALDKVKAAELGTNDASAFIDFDLGDYKFGTVGCVAIDKNGNIVAGTSTGGMTNKRWNRVGDSPIIGAGTYADNETCGLSATGWGEFFIRGVVAHDISARMKYANQSLKKAAQEVIQKEIPAMGGDGGIIGIDKNADIIMEFNTAGMFRASIDKDGKLQIGIYEEVF